MFLSVYGMQFNLCGFKNLQALTCASNNAYSNNDDNASLLTTEY